MVFSCVQNYAGIEQHFRKLEPKERSSPFRNVDNIYLINLDQRPEKLEICKQELSPYGIFPQRFPAIYGWVLSTQALSEIGLKYRPGMWKGREPVFYFPPTGNGSHQYIQLDDSCYGFTFFSIWTSRGAIGCTLSHLSVLQDAYDAGYRTIWVMEDDISVRDDPHKLSSFIDELDALVGNDGWDILYTDLDHLRVDPNCDFLSQYPMMWRPDMESFDLQILAQITEVGANFFKIGSRYRAHSLILRRSGMKKILDFYKTHNMFMPYDHEIFFAPNLQVFTLRHAIVTSEEICSDTKHQFFTQ